MLLIPVSTTPVGIFHQYTQGLRGNWFTQKNQKSKISWHCPFKHLSRSLMQKAVEDVRSNTCPSAHQHLFPSWPVANSFKDDVTLILFLCARSSCSQIYKPWPGDIVDSGIGLTYRPASLCSLAGWYDNLQYADQLYLPSQELWIWLLSLQLLLRMLLYLHICIYIAMKFSLLVTFTYACF